MAAVSGGSVGSLAVDDVAVGDTAVIAPGRHRIRVDYLPGSSPTIALRWRAAGSGAFADVPGAALSPSYGLVTLATVHDSTVGSPPSVTADAYGTAGGWPDPSAGRPTAVTVDPGGAALSTRHLYEAMGSGLFLRPLTRSQPAGDVSAYAHYGSTEARTNPCPGGTSANQGGRPRTTTGPSPDGTAPGLGTEAVYDPAGRVVATRRSSDPSATWTCRTYDPRGRPTSVAVPALPAPFGSPTGSPARTVSYTWATPASPHNPLVGTVGDGAGSVPMSTTVDLLGRTASYTDAWSNTTTSTYDQPGMLTDAVTHTGPLGVVTSTTHLDHDPAGRPTVQRLDGTTIATATYSAGELSAVTYANGSALAVTRDRYGSTTALAWAQAGGAVLTGDAVVRSQSGRVMANATDGTAATTAFTYSSPGRLATAELPGHSLVYDFAAGCASAPDAGSNANRTSVVDNGGTATTSCYNHADQLISSSDAAVGSPTYDSHANTTAVGTQALGYDGSDCHVSTTAGSTTDHRRPTHPSAGAATTDQPPCPRPNTTVGTASWN